MPVISWVLRWLVGTGLLLAVGAKVAGNHGKYPLEVHQMFQQRQNHRKVAVGGSWSAWSHWSPCTRSCDGGVAMQTRDCQTRPTPVERRRRRRLVVEAAAGSHNTTISQPRKATPQSQCVGVYKRFHICNDQPCPPGSKDFRQLQCEAFNHKPMEGRFYTWVPYVDAPNKCELNCRAVGNSFYARLNKTVVDGTRCAGDAPSPAFSVCVSGTCKTVGCDGVVGSAKRVDACGMCGGDNSTCRLVSGLFTRPTLPVGYNLIAQIPRGACNITISEMKHSRNYLALRRPDGSFVINGNWAINWSGEYDAGGARFTYRRQDNSGGESISSPGPLLEPVDIMVIYQQPNPGIKYEYMLPMKGDSMGSAPAVAPVPATAAVIPTVSHVPVPIQPGSIVSPSLILPPGINHPPDDITVKDGPVFENPDKRPENPALYPYGSGVLGTESQSRGVHHPGHQNAPPIGDEAHKPQPRNRGRKRKFTWKTIGFTECTKTCGGGIQTTITSCVREHNQQMVPDRRCASQERPNPQVIRCNIKPCPAEWIGGEWGECSVTCGEGIQTRNLICQQEVTSTLTMKVANGACLNPTNLPRTQKCAMPSCDNVDETHNRPQRSHWQVGQWSKCSVPCGQGKRTRTVQCIGHPGDNPDEQEECPPSERPAHEESCDMGSCPSSASAHAWFYTEWTQQCSEECGTGVQTRKVFCSSGQDETCDKNSRPDDSRACSSDKLCSGKWFAGPWGQCSTSCGRGRQTRDAVCVAFLHSQYRVVLDMNCPSAHKPETERACETRNCSPEWYVSDWSPCSRDCGSGAQRREVKCLDEKQQPSAECAEEKRPPGKRACNTHDCNNSAASPGEPHSVHFPSKFKDDPVLNNGAGDQAVSTTQEEKPHKEECVDTLRNCHLVVQARLCKLYKFYRTSCCHSCHKKL